MRKSGFFPKLALVNLARNSRFYLPYLLTIAGTAAAYYIAAALAGAGDLPLMTRYVYLSVFMQIGTVVIALFAGIFLTYTNSFLMKRRKKELGLYHVLGLGKRHIAVMLGLETLYTAAAGIGGGLALGLLLQKLVTLLLYKIMHFDAYFGFYISGKGILSTIALFSAILLLNLLMNLHRIRVQNPMEMLRESSAGEREPRTRWLTAIVGLACLCSGYGIALAAKSAISALTLYFVAVFLVIIGTYCLFTTVSIVVLKALRSNRRYYYRTNQFIGVSGMLYRMKRNAVGLANICILSTMVLVMVSGTLSLYLGSEHAVETQFPGNVGVVVEYDPTDAKPFQADMLSASMTDALTAGDAAPTPVYSYRCLPLYATQKDGAFEIRPSYTASTCQLLFLTEEEYGRVPGGALDGGAWETLTLRFPDGTLLRVETIRPTGQLPALGGLFTSGAEPWWMVVPEETDLSALYAAQRAALGENAETVRWRGFWNVEGTAEEQIALVEECQSILDFTGVGDFARLRVDGKAAFSEEYYALNGGFFFLGLFLGLLFIMATVLIIYYKQISEGYEDRERYLIMQKVGMEPQTVRRSVNAQVLVVFFAPLLVAGVHVAFDYGLMVRLLMLFSLYDASLTLWCTAGAFLTFAAVYALVYWTTAKLYYQIVQAR